MTDEKRVAVVVGAGPGLGSALTRRFVADGYEVACLSRKLESMTELAAESGAHAYEADARSEESLTAALTKVAEDLGPIDTLLWNVGSGVFGDVDQVGVDALDLAYETNTRGLMVAVKTCLPGMRKAERGNIIITGATASLRGKPFTTAFAAGKAAQRSLAESLARKLWPEGVHVALIVVDGMVGGPAAVARMPDKPAGFFIDPDGFAHAASFLCGQSRSAWTFQLEVRPHIESW